MKGLSTNLFGNEYSSGYEYESSNEDDVDYDVDYNIDDAVWCEEEKAMEQHA